MCSFETLTRPLRAGETGRGRAGHGMMVFNVLLNRYKLFWPRPSLFGGSQRESESGHAMGTVWGRKRSCVWLGVWALKPQSLYLFISFQRKTIPGETLQRNTGWKAHHRGATWPWNLKYQPQVQHIESLQCRIIRCAVIVAHKTRKVYWYYFSPIIPVKPLESSIMSELFFMETRLNY